MERAWGSFRTTEGTVSVGPQAIHIDRTPRSFLAGLFAGWHSGGVTRRLTVAYRVLFFGLAPIFTIYQLARILEFSRWIMVASGLSWVALGLVPLVVRYRERSIDRSAIVDVSLDTDTRELTVRHDPDSGWMALVTRLYGREANLRSDTPRSTTLTLPGEDAVREARSTLRTAGIVDEFESETASPTATRHRVETVRGVVFCEACGAQVSPADQACPTCSSQLRVEQPVDTPGSG